MTSPRTTEPNRVHATEREKRALQLREEGLSNTLIAERVRAAEERIARATARLADGDAIRGAKARAVSLADDLAQVEHTIAELRALAEKTILLHRDGAGQRITALRTGLDGVAGAGDLEAARDVAVGALGRDVELAAQTEAAFGRRVETIARLSDLEHGVPALKRALTDATAKAALEPTLLAAELEIGEASQERERALAAELAAVDAGKGHRSRLDVFLAEERKERARAADALTACVALQPTLKLRTHLDQAEARLAELDAQRAGLEVERDALVAERDALGPAPDAPPVPDTRAAVARVQAAEGMGRSAASAIAVGERIVRDARSGAERLAVLGAERAKREEDLADWTRLAADLVDLKTLEVDCAGPELTSMTNDLLRSCYGRRFTVTITTSRAHSDGKREIDCCEVRVLDAEADREDEAETFSGGERVILGEAIALSLSTLACKRAGMTGVTLIRDESGAALDEENAPLYVAMLRRAGEIVDASIVLLVTHSKDALAQCDACIEIKDGHITITESA